MAFVYHNIPDWIEENKKDFLPPVCNKMMHNDQLKVFYVGGPNIRKDFHLEEGEEFFYMVNGDMNLITLKNNAFKDVQIKEGEVFLLPGRIPHSPQRYDNTVGLVIERERLRSEMDCVRYYVEGTKDALFERWFYCKDLGTQLGPLINEYFASEQYKTGKSIPGTITENPPFTVDDKRKLEDPFSLTKWIQQHRSELDVNGKKNLFNASYKSEITVYGKGEAKHLDKIESWMWQIEGESLVEVDGKKITMKTKDSLLVSSNMPFKHSRRVGSISLIVKMNPGKSG